MISVIVDKKIVRRLDVETKLYPDKVVLFMFTEYDVKHPDNSLGFVACTYDYEGELGYTNPELREKFRELPYVSSELMGYSLRKPRL